MSRIFLVILAPAIALALFSCRGDEPAQEEPRPTPSRSRLHALKPEGFDEGLALPDFTRYWADAENGNGNSYPVSGRVDANHTLSVRLNKDGDFFLRTDGEFKKGSIYTVLTRMERLRDEYWIEDRQATAAALMLFADERASSLTLLKLCKELASLQVSNLWLVTYDRRDDALRLLALTLDVPQVFAEWYGLDDKELARTARLHIQVGDEMGTPRHTLTHLGRSLAAATTDGAAELLGPFKDARVERIQFQFSGSLRISHFALGVELVSPLGFKDVELFWPALDWGEDLKPLRPRRELAEYQDQLRAADGIDIPTLSDYWRASAANQGLPPPAVIDPELPLLAVRVDADGNYATRARGESEWAEHETDAGVLEAMRENAGEIDFNTLISDLQVLVAMDRNTPWIEFLGVMEMMKTARCFRLFALAHDVIGPTRRLIDLSLSLTDIPSGAEVATLIVKREGLVDDARYDVTLTLKGREYHTTGASYTASLSSWVSGGRARPKVLVLTLPRDEPFGTMFTILNSLAWLGMKDIRVTMIS